MIELLKFHANLHRLVFEGKGLGAISQPYPQDSVDLFKYFKRRFEKLKNDFGFCMCRLIIYVNS